MCFITVLRSSRPVGRTTNCCSKMSCKKLDSDTTSMAPESRKGPPPIPPKPHLTEEGLVIPRKLPNPILENSDRRNLHRELRFNQKIGKNVLDQKPELQKAFEKRKDNIAKKELDNHSSSKTVNELDKVFADRAKRRQDAAVVDQSGDYKDLCKDAAIVDQNEDKALYKKFVEARAKLRTITESK